MLPVRDMRICVDLVAHIKIVEAILENKGGRIFFYQVGCQCCINK